MRCFLVQCDSIPTVAKLTDQIRALAKKGLSKIEIARRLQISRTSVRRLLGQT